MEQTPQQGAPQQTRFCAETAVRASSWPHSDESRPSSVNHNPGQDASPSAALSGTVTRATVSR